MRKARINTGSLSRIYVEDTLAPGAQFALLPPDNATGNFTKVVQRIPVRIRVEDAVDAKRPLRPGMSVQATVVTK